MPSQARHRFSIDQATQDQRLDRFLHHHFPKLPQALIQKLLRKRAIKVENRRATANTRLQLGETVEVWTDLSEFEQGPDGKTERLDRLRNSRRFKSFFRPLHEDRSILVLDKPAGIVVHPSRGHRKGDTLLDLVEAHLADTPQGKGGFKPAFAHRLDQGTSGVIVVAKTREAAGILESFFRAQQVEKRYLVLVNGNVPPAKGVIELGIEEERLPSGITRFRTSRAVDAMQAKTKFEVLERLKGATLLKVDLGTGRTHQIRVHFAALGNPVVGDGEYGSKGLNRRHFQDLGLRRTFLHASELQLPHPDTGSVLKFKSPMPAELEAILRTLRGT
jgi:RluA family pseudouridine synthase